jgi:diguanylate cyclase (GGDEF)-like protein
VVIGGISGLFLFRISEIKAQRDRLKAEVDARTEELARLAATDSLTGVANRRHFIQHAAEELAHSHRFDRPFCILMMDIDHFKRINDRYGHAVGDATLRALVTVLNDAKRESDLLGRLGGDEFAVVLRESDGRNGRVVAERLRQQAAATQVTSDGEEISFTVSFGIAARETAGDTLEGLMRRADAALYRAKNRGRNRVEMS